MEKFQKLPFDNREIDWRILVQDHITAANYGIAGALGTAPPAGFLSGDKSKVLQAMKDSFWHFRNAIVASDAEADKPQKMFNRQTTLRGSFLIRALEGDRAALDGSGAAANQEPVEKAKP